MVLIEIVKNVSMYRFVFMQSCVEFLHKVEESIHIKQVKNVDKLLWITSVYHIILR